MPSGGCTLAGIVGCESGVVVNGGTGGLEEGELGGAFSLLAV